MVSEIGKMAKEILEASNYGKRKPKYRKELKEEIGDVFYSLINLANHYKIDLEEALDLVLEKYEKRIKTKNTAASKPKNLVK